MLNQKYLKISKISSKLLLGLTEDILDLAKMEAGIFKLNENLFSISDLIEDIEYTFEMQCQQKGLYFRIEARELLRSSQFRSDMNRIKQVLMNLISNAFKFTVTGGITVKIAEAQTLNDSHEVENYLHFTVRDTGIGIPHTELPKLFKMFGRASDQNRGLNLQGSGLGLTISKKLVNSMGGKIKLKSYENQGT